MIRRTILEQLAPLLDGDRAASNGEWPIHCPYHGDSKRSGSLNVKTDRFYCHGCGESGNSKTLLRDKDNWNLDSVSSNGTKSSGRPKERITEEKVDGWHEALVSDRDLLRPFRRRRGLNLPVLKTYQIGYDHSARAYTIPIRDAMGFIVNVRRWDIEPAEDRRKIWSVEGMGTPTLWPLDQLADNDAIVLCEGEWDALTCIQRGIPALTRTGTADHWKKEWSELFKGKRVYICHDMDTKGQKANDRIAAALRPYAASITIVKLPFEVQPKDGKDLTDYWKEGHDKSDFLSLIRDGEAVETQPEVAAGPAMEVPVTVMDSFDASLVGHRLTMEVTVAGKRIPSYLVPKVLSLNCDVGAGKKCDTCTLEEQRGHAIVRMEATERNLLKMVDVRDDALEDVIRSTHGINQCNRLQIDITEHMTVEEVYVRPSIDDPNSGGDFTHRKVLSAGSHDLESNSTVRFTGAIWPSPKTQGNEFVAWAVDKPPNALDQFEIGEQEIELMKVFAVIDDDPLVALAEISDDLAMGCTMIINRPELHTFIDLAMHSALRFYLGGEEVDKGWLDVLVIGDTRTGKSKIAQALIDLYGMGEMISCESASYAGVVGGLDRVGDGKWIVKWGAIPVNDGRAVILDEVSGLSTDQIAQMSSIRSSGLAQLTKIESEKANARTRLVWLANPRNSAMADHFYGVNALDGLIGNPEDIARFDMVMGAFNDDVPSSAINQFRAAAGLRYSEDSYRTLLRWVWTRTADQVSWAAGAEAQVLKTASVLGNMYRDVPPLIQAANVRIKLARIAVAMAARLFSTDKSFKKIVVRREHVISAAKFLQQIYDHPRFGYGQASGFLTAEVEETRSNLKKIMEYIKTTPMLQKFLRSQPAFTRYDVELSMGVGREFAGAVIQHLWTLGAVQQVEGKVVLNPTVLAELRKVYSG